MKNNHKEQVSLWNRNLSLVVVAAFMQSIAFFMLMPIIAKYAMDRFEATASMAGVVVSVYIISALIVRPFSGYLADKYDRKRLYLLTFILFTLFCYGYTMAVTIPLLIMLRILLGGTFSVMTTSGNTLAIDFMPSARRGEGIGYMGAFTVLAMAVGPMLGLYLIESHSYDAVFVAAGSFALIGVLCVTYVKNQHRPTLNHPPISLDRFVLKKGLSIALVMLLLSFPYGTIMAYTPLFLQEFGLDVVAANFFLYFAIGVVISRLVTGKLLNRGLHHTILVVAMPLIAVGFYIFAFANSNEIFPFCSVLLGLSYGSVMPSIQSMIINLAHHNRRGTANSTYYIALDMGSGLGMLMGGTIAHLTSYQTLVLISIVIVSLTYTAYLLYIGGHYKKILEKFVANPTKE